MNGYPADLKSQHDEIRTRLEDLNQTWKEKNFASCRALLQSLQCSLHDHHELETEVLFQKIQAENRLSQGGGPFCSYFFDFFLNNRPRDKVERRLSGSRSAPSASFQIPLSLKSFFDQNSLLCIPLEEHIAIQMLIDELFRMFSENQTDDIRWIDEALTDVTDLVRLNFQKEETCLWEAFKFTRLSVG